MLIVLALSAKLIAPLFNDDPKIVSTTILYLMIVPIGFGFQGVLQISATTLNVLQKPFHAAVLVGTQMFILYIPLAYTGSFVFGLKGAFFGIVAAQSLAGVIAHFMLARILGSEIEKAESVAREEAARSAA